MLCDDLGYEAMQEHAYADVWVKNTPPLAIEVQRWATNFAVRFAARQAMGANVLWLLPESASSKKAGQDLFRHPAARLRVLRRGSRTEEAKPWEPGHSGRPASSTLRTHACNADFEIPISAQTCFCDIPCVSTRATASRLNSSENFTGMTSSFPPRSFRSKQSQSQPKL